MKKILLKMTALTALLSASSFAFADAADELQNRLNQVTVLSADFAQTVTSVGGKNVQQGSGKLQIKRPNLFRMDTKSPQETQIINDQIFSVWIPNHHKKHKLLQMVKPFGITIHSCNKLPLNG